MRSSLLSLRRQTEREARIRIMTAQINTTKLIVLSVLGFCALVLGCAVLTLQLYVQQLKQKHGISNSRRLPRDDVVVDTKGVKGKVPFPKTTIKHSQPTNADEIHLSHRFPPPAETSIKTSGEAYWRHAAAFLKEWDVLLTDSDNDDIIGAGNRDRMMIPEASEYLSERNGTAYPRLALEKAAQAGHPLAQHYLANAHASGIWPVSVADEMTTDELHVFEEWLPNNQGDHPQVTKSFVLWQMAAMAGNVEAAMALAYRLEHLEGSPGSCQDVLPYYEAAAHGVMDQLETSPHSRAKAIPNVDKHTLARVHMHGGTSSQLDWNNKPDESKEALQYFHLKATTTPWSTKGSADTKAPTIDVNAASTLAHMYHHGIRGVPQNLTLSLQYYEIAAHNGDMHSAGQAGTFYLWGMGVEQDVQEAMKLFKLGAPYDVEECRKRHVLHITKNKQRVKDEDDLEHIKVCEKQSLNGLGLLNLLGIPSHLEVDLELAEDYFLLAKQMGSADAMYNLAMMWLGWKSHFKQIEDLSEDGVSSRDVEQGFDLLGRSEKKGSPTYALHFSRPKSSEQQYFKGPKESTIQDAVKMLVTAANHDHIQAKHRLAMIYSEGISLMTSALNYNAVKKDCQKSKLLYRWIVENASIVRAKRLRKGYTDYIAGNLESSLRNYLAAAETGSNVGQVNAAFLLERGTCLGLSPEDCAKASVRLWKAAASLGSAEACLRVGDFYYYGRLRGEELPTGPLAWVQYVLYPEEHLLKLFKKWYAGGWAHVNKEAEHPEETCEGEDCGSDTDKSETDAVDADLAMAGHYYLVASERHQSPRANFNLGFMHEWGIGLKQDFPLAKRHYDLAKNSNSKEADLAAYIALMVMNIHEYFVKWQAAWRGKKKKQNIVPAPITPDAKFRQPGTVTTERSGKTEWDVIKSHIFETRTFVIIVCLYVLGKVMELRNRQQHQRRR